MKVNAKPSVFFVIFVILALAAFIFLYLQPVYIDCGKVTRLGSQLSLKDYNIERISEFKGPRGAAIGVVAPGKYIVAGDCAEGLHGCKVGLAFLGGETKYEKPFALCEITNSDQTHFEFEVTVKSFKPASVKEDKTDYSIMSYDTFTTEGWLVESILLITRSNNPVGSPVVFVTGRSLSTDDNVHFEWHNEDAAVVINPK